jgi:hypothetical protein
VSVKLTALVSVSKLCQTSGLLSLSSPRGEARVQSHVVLVVAKQAFGSGFFFKYFGFSLSMSFNQSATLIHLSVTEDAGLPQP